LLLIPLSSHVTDLTTLRAVVLSHVTDLTTLRAVVLSHVTHRTFPGRGNGPRVRGWRRAARRYAWIMRLYQSIVLLVVLGCAVGCGKPDEGVSDAAAATCDPARAVQCVDGPVRAQACTGDPIQVGTLCDDLFACVTDEAAAQALTDVAPDFACAPGPGEPAACDASQYACHWQAPGTIDAAELEAICAVTVLPMPPAQVMCMVYI
jgi:hypothetical protein